MSISQTPDASALLSTAALLSGIFLTVTATALTITLPDNLNEFLDKPGERSAQAEARALLRRVFAVLVVLNTLATLGPFCLLFVEVLRPLPRTAVILAFAGVVIVIAANLLMMTALVIGPWLASARINRAAAPPIAPETRSPGDVDTTNNTEPNGADHKP